MKYKSFYNWSSYLIVFIFILYWSIIFILAMPRNFVKTGITANAPRFKNLFGYTWKLFTPPAQNNPRLYIIVRNHGYIETPDSTEILLPIAKDKQAKAPFNNKETIIDYLVNVNVNKLITLIWHNKIMPLNNTGADSLIRKNAINEATNYTLFKTYLSSVEAYCRLVIKEKQLYKKGNEARIVITEKLTRPFSAIGNTDYIDKEWPVFETDFSPIAL